MSNVLSLPIDRFVKVSRPSELAALVRQTLEDNSSRLERAITAGAMTVSVPAEELAIEIKDRCSGNIRVVIGDLAWLIEELPFAINWAERTIDIQLPGEGPGASPARKLRIICAEEEMARGGRLSDCLSSRGHFVSRYADSGALLVELGEAEACDVLIADDGLEGLQLVTALAVTSLPLRIIVSYQSLDPGQEAQYRRLGVVAFLPKLAPYERVLRVVEGDENSPSGPSRPC